MKKIILIAFSGMILSSCELQPDGQAQPKTDGNLVASATEYTYDGCQYVRFGYGDCAWGAHKGNCNNPIHKK